MITLKNGVFQIPCQGDIFRVRAIQQKEHEGRIYWFAKMNNEDLAFVLELGGSGYKVIFKGTRYLANRYFSLIDFEAA